MRKTLKFGHIWPKWEHFRIFSENAKFNFFTYLFTFLNKKKSNAWIFMKIGTERHTDGGAFKDLSTTFQRPIRIKTWLKIVIFNFIPKIKL